MKSTLKALAQLILRNVEVLEADCEKRGLDIPNLEDVYTFGSDILNAGDPEVIKASHEISSAALELANIVRPAHHSLFLLATGVRIMVTIIFNEICLTLYALPRRSQPLLCDALPRRISWKSYGKQVLRYANSY